jgi:hypothetical protein
MEAIHRFAAVTLTLVVMVASSPARSEPALHEPDSLDPNCGVVFSGNSAHVLADTFFSRGDVGALWDPTPIEISQLEEALARELSDRLDDGGPFFFIAFYDPQSRRIVGFRSNGVG